MQIQNGSLAYRQAMQIIESHIRAIGPVGIGSVIQELWEQLPGAGSLFTRYDLECVTEECVRFLLRHGSITLTVIPSADGLDRRTYLALDVGSEPCYMPKFPLV